MSTAVWPYSLPARPLVQGFLEQTPETRLRTQMAAGAAKVRNRYTAGVRSIEMKVRLTGEQVDTLEAFYSTTLKGGALPFDWVHPRSGGALTYRFVEPPSLAPAGRGRLWTATLKLEALP